MNRLMTAVSALGALGALSAASPASAHVSLTRHSVAGSNQVLTFGVGHGCEGADSVRIEVEIPESVLAVRGMPSAWGEAQLVLDDAELVRSVVWEKAEARPTDDSYYQFSIRAAIPEDLFTILYFKTTQTCRTAEGEDVVSEWHASLEEAENAPAGEHPMPAPLTVVMPPRAQGWNKFETPVEITDLRMFDDAQIVWVGSKAYSANPATLAMIEDDDSVELLESIPADSEIWVKY